jgi:hypothetical protein
MNVGDVIDKFYQRRQDADEGATRGARRAELTIIEYRTLSQSSPSTRQSRIVGIPSHQNLLASFYRLCSVSSFATTWTCPVTPLLLFLYLLQSSSWRQHRHVWQLGTAMVPTLMSGSHRCNEPFVRLESYSMAGALWTDSW